MSGLKQSSQRPATAAVRTGIAADTSFGAVIPPIYVSANYAFESLDKPGKYDYARSGNPNRDHLADALSQLEGGAGGVVTNSGMSAVTLASQLVGTDEVVFVPADCYGGTHRLFTALHKQRRCRVVFVDYQNLDNLRTHVAEQRPRLVWIETPSNPLLRLSDIQAVCDIAHEAGALALVDNTFLSPLWQQPIALGADLVLHSTTKYINGHSDVVGGAVIAANKSLHEELAWWANCLGLTASPQDCHNTLRGLRTLSVRLRAHAANTLRVVDRLVDHPEVRRVHFPGIADHPNHDLACRQQSSFGAIVSFELKQGLAGCAAFTKHLKNFTLAESLGGVESLVCHPATMTHAAMSAADQRKAGITEGLLRLSVGIEDGDDLASDVLQALDALSGVHSKLEVCNV